jgi:hypothetical protein
LVNSGERFGKSAKPFFAAGLPGADFAPAALILALPSSSSCGFTLAASMAR